MYYYLLEAEKKSLAVLKRLKLQTDVEEKKLENIRGSIDRSEWTRKRE